MCFKTSVNAFVVDSFHVFVHLSVTSFAKFCFFFTRQMAQACLWGAFLKVCRVCVSEKGFSAGHTWAFYGLNNNKPGNPNLHQINDTREFPHIILRASHSVPGKLESSVKTKLDFCDSSWYFEISCNIHCYYVDSDTTYEQM